MAFEIDNHDDEFVMEDDFEDHTKIMVIGVGGGGGEAAEGGFRRPWRFTGAVTGAVSVTVSGAVSVTVTATVHPQALLVSN